MQLGERLQGAYHGNIANTTRCDLIHMLIDHLACGEVSQLLRRTKV